MAIELFGFEIKSKKEKKGKTFVTPENLDGATTVVDGGGILGHYLNTDADAKNEKVLVQKYREMSFSQEVDGAVEDITSSTCPLGLRVLVPLLFLVRLLVYSYY